MNLFDLTKEELIELIAFKGWGINLHEDDISYVKRQVKYRKLRKQEEEAFSNIERNRGNRTKFMEAMQAHIKAIEKLDKHFNKL